MDPNVGRWRISQLEPRSFDELHTERLYLLNSLQHQNSRATEVLRNLPFIEETAVHSPDPRIRRHARKELGWLRRRMREITGQEKSILARLGQLAYEIQSRERLTQIESERQSYQQNLGQPFAFCQGMQQMQLEPSTLKSNTYRRPMIYTDWQNPPEYSYGRNTSQQRTIQEYVSELPAEPQYRDEGSLKGVGEDASQYSGEKVVSHRSASVNDADISAFATNVMCEDIPAVKRYSLSGVPLISQV